VRQGTSQDLTFSLILGKSFILSWFLISCL
jgi:hypothetical protein